MLARSGSAAVGGSLLAEHVSSGPREHAVQVKDMDAREERSRLRRRTWLQARRMEERRASIAAVRSILTLAGVADAEGSRGAAHASPDGALARADSMDLADEPATASASASAASASAAAGPHAASAAGKQSRVRAGRVGDQRFWASQLMIPEWLTDVPSDLHGRWLVMPRPQGTRCLLVSSRARTCAVARNGRVLQVFASALPGGGPYSAAHRREHTVLDAIFSADRATFFVLDLLVWRGSMLYDCSFEFRRFWLLSKLEELDHSALTQSAANAFPIVPVPCAECSAGNLVAAHHGAPLPFERDGLLFFHKQAPYVRATSPFALVWKDQGSCSYFASLVSDLSRAVLELNADGTLQTSDSPPVVLGRLPVGVSVLTPDDAAAVGDGSASSALVAGACYVCAVEAVDVENARVAGVRVVQRQHARAVADSWTKLVFHWQLRQGCAVQLPQLVAATSRPAVLGDDPELCEWSQADRVVCE